MTGFLKRWQTWKRATRLLQPYWKTPAVKVCCYRRVKLLQNPEAPWAPPSESSTNGELAALLPSFIPTFVRRRCPEQAEMLAQHLSTPTPPLLLITGMHSSCSLNKLPCQLNDAPPQSKSPSDPHPDSPPPHEPTRNLFTTSPSAHLRRTGSPRPAVNRSSMFTGIWKRETRDADNQASSFRRLSSKEL